MTVIFCGSWCLSYLIWCCYLGGKSLIASFRLWCVWRTGCFIHFLQCWIISFYLQGSSGIWLNHQISSRASHSSLGSPWDVAEGVSGSQVCLGRSATKIVPGTIISCTLDQMLQIIVVYLLNYLRGSLQNWIQMINLINSVVKQRLNSIIFRDGTEPDPETHQFLSS